MPTDVDPDGRLAEGWPVMVLAHNEEGHIATCLDSIFSADSDQQFDIFVMANGCTDRTEEIVLKYRERQPRVQLVSIALGDKCNAWNVFLHETVPKYAPNREVYFFMDGDAQATRSSFTALANALRANRHAHAASAVPMSGRSADKDRREILEQHGLVANLYAMRGTFVEDLREKGVRIPLKLEGDDGLIGALIKWDLDPRQNEFDDGRIVPCAGAGFVFESMSPWRLSHWRSYWKRLVRYGRRRHEFQLLGRALRAKGLAGLPQDITELYRDAHMLSAKWNGPYTLTDWIALRAMRRIGRSTGGDTLTNYP